MDWPSVLGCLLVRGWRDWKRWESTLVSRSLRVLTLVMGAVGDIDNSAIQETVQP